MAGAALCGAALALTLPPFDVLPALIAYSGLVLILDAGDRHATHPLWDRLWVGLSFGFAYHLAGLWWIGAAFLVDAEAFAALLPLAVIGLPLLLAPFHGLAAVLAGLAPPGLGARTVALAGALATTEWLRGFAFTGFPWNVPAVQLSGSLTLVQGVAVVGIVGLAPLAVLLGAAPALLVRRRIALVSVIAAVTGVVALYGFARLGNDAVPLTDTNLRIVQPAVPQEQKWDSQYTADIWRRLLQMTAAYSPDGTRPSVVIWPETALPFIYRVPSFEQSELSAALGTGRTLVTGGVDIEDSPEGERASNSIFVIDDEGFVSDRYDKAHLVPFGEYLPLSNLFGRVGLQALASRANVFQAGNPRTVLSVPGLPRARPLICYEAIFRRPPTLENPQWNLNLTNDAWFGNTPGPYQHLRHVVLRTIEDGRTTVRAANTGISGVIEPYGNIKFTIPIGQIGFRDVSLFERVHTPYTWLGNGPFTFLMLLLLAWVVWRRRQLTVPSDPR